MKKVVHLAKDRGFADHGWLKAAHSFSFAGYYNPAKIHFGMLRVLNDDIIAPAMGFGTHGHDNMEIVTIPLRGSLAHKDSLGSEGLISPGEVQIMSAGSGIQHSEFNGSENEEVNLLQIWVFPKERNINPRYDQKRFNPELANNRFQILVSADKTEDSMWINQDAVFALGNFQSRSGFKYSIKHPGNGVYIFVIEGAIELDDTPLKRRDAAGVYETHEIPFMVNEPARILAIEVPMR